MNELNKYFSTIIELGITKIIMSKPVSSNEEYSKIVVEKKGEIYHVSKYTDKQVFHENILEANLCERCISMTYSHFLQVNAWCSEYEHIMLISKKGSSSYKRISLAQEDKRSLTSIDHNKKKQYILTEDTHIQPLIDMGIFTTNGKVINSMYHKYKQINRFLEILDDEIKKSKVEQLNIIDFGCGKSYLTFVIYYYLTQIKNIRTNIIGLDLKKDVIEKCNATAIKYGYDGLKFELGDINSFNAPFSVDIVLTLHACNTATDYALFNAVKWNAKMIFSVPCCQHELNQQIDAQSISILTRYGIIKERFSALATDAIRANLMEYCGYKTQLLEFIDFEHTPKNILIRAVKRSHTPKSSRIKSLVEVETLMKEFGFIPTLYTLLKSSGEL